MVARGHGAHAASRSGAPARQSIVRRRVRHAGRRCVRSRDRLVQHPRGGRPGRLPGHADLAAAASGRGCVNRGVRRLGAPVGILLAVEAQRARAIQIPLGSVIRWTVPADDAGCRRRTRGCARSRARLRDGYSRSAGSMRGSGSRGPATAARNGLRGPRRLRSSSAPGSWRCAVRGAAGAQPAAQAPAARRFATRAWRAGRGSLRAILRTSAEARAAVHPPDAAS